MTTKEIKKKHSARPVGGVVTGTWGGDDSQQGSDWGTSEEVDCGAGQAVGHLADPEPPHLHMDKPGGMAGEQNIPHNPGLQLREIKPQTTD